MAAGRNTFVRHNNNQRKIQNNSRIPSVHDMLHLLFVYVPWITLLLQYNSKLYLTLLHNYLMHHRNYQRDNLQVFFSKILIIILYYDFLLINV